MRAPRWRHTSPRPRKVLHAKSVAIAVAALLLAGGTVLAATRDASAALGFEVQSLDGRGNNRANPDRGKAGTQDSRGAPARYADGRSAPVTGTNSRRISNRAFHYLAANIF